MSSRPATTVRRVLVSTVGVAAALAIGATSASAMWTANASGAGKAVSRTLAAPGAPAGGSTTQTTAAVSWTAAAAMPTGSISYTVERALFGGTSWTTACTTSHPAATGGAAVSCTDSGLTAGTDYQYRVTSRYGAWRAVSSVGASVKTADPTSTTLSIDSFAVGAGQTVVAGGMAAFGTTGDGAVTLTLCKVNTWPCPTAPTNQVAQTITISQATIAANGGSWSVTSGNLNKLNIHGRAQQARTAGALTSNVAGPVAP